MGVELEVLLVVGERALLVSGEPVDLGGVIEERGLLEQLVRGQVYSTAAVRYSARALAASAAWKCLRAWARSVCVGVFFGAAEGAAAPGLGAGVACAYACDPAAPMQSARTMEASDRCMVVMSLVWRTGRCCSPTTPGCA